MPQGLVISSTISAEKFFALQPKIKELLESRDPDEMLRFIGSMDSDFDSVVLPDNHPQDLHGSPDMIKQVMHKAKNDFYLFFTFMSKIPPISSDELAQLVERASVQLSFRQIVGRKFPLDTLDPQELDTERDPPATGSGNFAEFIDVDLSVSVILSQEDGFGIRIFLLIEITTTRWKIPTG